MIMEEVLKELRVQNKLLALLCQAKVGYSGNAGDSPEKKLDKYLSKSAKLLDVFYQSVATSPMDS